MVLPTQGIMVSERPSASLGDSAATAGGGGPLAGAGSIGNYKGVMLCNRPFAGTAAAAKGGEVSVVAGKLAFVTGKVKSEVGFAGKHLQTEKLLRKRVKQETALTRHRRWLTDLQMTKQALEEQYMEDLRKKEESRRRFAERESRMRQITRDLAIGVDKNDIVRSEELGSKAWTVGLDDETKPTTGADTTNGRRSIGGETEHLHEEKSEEDVRLEQEENRVEHVESRAVEKRRKRDGKPCRPMWAMTKAKAQAEDDLKHEEELEELLEFTQGLDFGRYIRDAEVQSMIDQVKKRIIEIEGQPEVCNPIDDGNGGESERDEDTPEDCLDEAEARLEAKIMKLTDKNLRDLETNSYGDDDAVGSRNQQEDDNISIARTALSEGGRSVRSVHSTRSLTAVVEKARMGIVTARAGGGGSTAPARCQRGNSEGTGSNQEMEVNEIVVVTHQDDGGLRLGGKNTVSNLPYIRRNPAL